MSIGGVGSVEGATKVGYDAMGGVAASDVKVESREVRGKGEESFVRIRAGGCGLRCGAAGAASKKLRKTKTAPEGAAILSRKRSKLRPLQKRSLSFPEAQKSKINIA